jgi:hypothetical protein
LKKANDQAEHFEREWYLRGDEIERLKAAQPAQEPVGVFREDDDIGYVDLVPHQGMKLKDGDFVYTTPPKREWVRLTDEETQSYWDWEDWQTGAGRSTIFEMVRDIEAKLKERNG